MQQSSETPMSQVEMQQCIQDCLNCHRVCLDTAEKYRQAAKEQSRQAYIYMLLDCADICLTAAHFMQHNSPLSGYTCDACAHVCAHCEGECQQAGDTDCANACQTCAQSCGQMTKLVP